MNISDLRLPARQTKASAGPKRGSFDLPFFVLTLLLLTIGVIMVLSSSFARAYAQGKSPTYYFVRQAAFAVAGVVAMILLSKVRMVTYRRLSLLVLGVSIFLLAVVWIPHIGTRVNGARRWLSLGFTTFQPSEIAKIAVVLFFSSMICTYKEQMQTFRYGVVPFMVVTVIIVGLLMLEPHLSASIIIMALAIVMMFVGGIKLSYLLVGMGSAGALLLIASKFVPYVHKRIVSWRDPFADTSAAGYQIVQSLYSIGSGGFLGLGLGHSGDALGGAGGAEGDLRSRQAAGHQGLAQGQGLIHAVEGDNRDNTNLVNTLQNRIHSNSPSLIVCGSPAQYAQ